MSIFSWRKSAGDKQADTDALEAAADGADDVSREGELQADLDSPEAEPRAAEAHAEVEAETLRAEPDSPEPVTPEVVEEPPTSLADIVETSSWLEAEPAEEPAGPALPATSSMLDPGQRAVDEFFGPPRLDRPRPERPPLIPQWVWIASASVVGFVVIVLAAVAFYAASANIPVPGLTGVNSDVARVRLAEQGLRIVVVEHRYSTSLPDTVLTQSPPQGTKLRRGDAVAVVVSAGTEQFSMPGVVGDGLLLARSKLQQRGLEVRIESQPSQQPSGTVLTSNPPAGYAVHTGDIVRLTIAAAGMDTSLLLPFDMTGVRIVIDPAPVADAQTDVPLDIARRLRSLIEASQGIVVTTRALADTSTLDPGVARVQRAAAATATVAVGFSVGSQGAGGLVVYSPSPVLPFASASVKLGSRITSDLAGESGTVLSATSSTDTVLVAARAPWARVQLGSVSQREDLAKFNDSSWEDSVARALYRALAVTYGKRTTP